MERTNILVLGKTGVGKSSLLNYLLGGDYAVVGDGKPVTPKGIYSYPPFTYNEIEIAIYDSWGLEPDKADGWKDLITAEVQKHDSKDIRDWFHTVVYCVDAQRTRLENFEITEILRPLEDSGNAIVFVLTKADLATDKEKESLIMAIKESFPAANIVDVCTVSTKLRNGTETRPYNRELLCELASKNLVYNIYTKALRRFRKAADTAINDAKEGMIAYFEQEAGPVGVFTHYGDDFRNKMLTFMQRALYNNIDQEKRQTLYRAIDSIRTITKNLPAGFFIPTVHAIPEPDFSGVWDNDVSEYARGLLDTLLVFTITSRKERYRDKLLTIMEDVSAKVLVNIDKSVYSCLQKVARSQEVPLRSGHIRTVCATDYDGRWELAGF